MMTAQQAAYVLDTDLRGQDVLFTGVSTDSRTLQPGNLFVALSGERFDGSKFIGEAMQKGAVAAMVEASADVSYLPTDFPLLQVEDTRVGLGQLAAFWRKRFELPVVGVTGSNGKTTVKEMIAAILRQAKTSHVIEDTVLATEGNLNNDIGVPQMLLRLRDYHQYAVIEMGMNHLGEISYLTNMTKPDVAVITNAGAAHIEGLGSVETVANAKGEVFEGLSQQGTAVINADDTFAPLWRDLAGGRRIVDFGLNAAAQIGVENPAEIDDGSIVLRLPDGVAKVNLQTCGSHNVKNALAAAAVAVAMGIDKEMIVAGLETFKGVPGRMQRKLGLRGATIIDDTYNANPESVRAALAFLASTGGNTILVLGDMGELGDAAVDLHRQIGQEAKASGLQQLLALGKLTEHTVEAFGSGGRHFETIEELLVAVESLLAADIILLIKGSRFMRMERVVKQFVV